MRVPLLFVCFSLIALHTTRGAEHPNPGGIFDPSGLDVPKEEEKNARKTVKKDEIKADAALPEKVRQMLDKLTVYELVVNDFLTRQIEPLRSSLKDNLVAMSDKNTGAAKIDCLSPAKWRGNRSRVLFNPGSLRTRPALSK